MSLIPVLVLASPALGWIPGAPEYLPSPRRYNEVIESVTLRAIRLRLPESVRLHPVFHVSLLEPAANDPYPGQLQPPPPPVEVDGEEEWLVDDILDARIRYRNLQYLVKWTGYDQPAWEDATNVNGLQAVDNFHQAHPDKPSPLLEES